MLGAVQVQGWEDHLAPFTSVFSQKCVIVQHLSHQHVVDAKTLYDMVLKDVAGNGADRRAAVDLCSLRDMHRVLDGCRIT